MKSQTDAFINAEIFQNIIKNILKLQNVLGVYHRNYSMTTFLRKK